jgi:hypothetical protein
VQVNSKSPLLSPQNQGGLGLPHFHKNWALPDLVDTKNVAMEYTK